MPKGRTSLDQQLGSILEAWVQRDVPEDHCRFCNEPLDELKEPSGRYCDEECASAFGDVLQARLALGERDMRQRGFG